MHILSPETDNCPSWISGRERMTVENISWSISTKECCRPRRGLNPRPPGLQSDGVSNWATEAGRVLYIIKSKYCDITLKATRILSLKFGLNISYLRPYKYDMHTNVGIRSFFLFWYILNRMCFYINPSLAEHDMPCLSKQCRSRSVGFWRSQLIWICTVCH